MLDPELMQIIILGVAAGVGYAVTQMLIVAASLLWRGGCALVHAIQDREHQRREAIRAAEQAVKDAAHRAWFVAEMRRDPNSFGGNHHEWEFRPGE